MTQPIDSVFGLHQQAMSVLGRRMRLLSTNIANADTPHFKARDIDFRAALARASETAAGPAKTHHRHLDTGSAFPDRVDPLYRIPVQPALDGNTVDTQIEKTAFAETALRYESALTFLNRRISGLRSALSQE